MWCTTNLTHEDNKFTACRSRTKRYQMRKPRYLQGLLVTNEHPRQSAETEENTQNVVCIKMAAGRKNDERAKNKQKPYIYTDKKRKNNNLQWSVNHESKLRNDSSVLPVKTIKQPLY